MIKLNKLNKAEIVDIYSDMLTQFPPDELKSLEHLQALVENDNYRFYSIIYDNCAVGYIGIFFTNNFLWVDYFAIFKEFHSKGFGSKVLAYLKEYFTCHRGCFLEVEKINKDDINTQRRADFYIKHGAKRLDVRYFFPSKNPFEMDLYYISYDSNSATSDDIRIAVKDAFLTIHSDVDNVNEIYSKIEF